MRKWPFHWFVLLSYRSNSSIKKSILKIAEINTLYQLTTLVDKLWSSAMWECSAEQFYGQGSKSQLQRRMGHEWGHRCWYYVYQVSPSLQIQRRWVGGEGELALRYKKIWKQSFILHYDSDPNIPMNIQEKRGCDYMTTPWHVFDLTSLDYSHI